MIKIIHQTWKVEEVPDYHFPNVWQESWKRHHPDWEYRLWTDADNEKLVRDSYPEFWRNYSAITKGVLKADVARALYLHKFGGMYADLDHICLRPMDEMLRVAKLTLCGELAESATVVARNAEWEKWPRLLNNAWMYSYAPGNWALLRLVEDGLGYFAEDHNRQHGNLEEIVGGPRMCWLMHTYGNRANFAAAPRDIICPYGPMHEDTSEDGFNKWRDIDYVEENYKGVYAVTPWRGCWFHSRWSRSGTRPTIEGS